MTINQTEYIRRGGMRTSQQPGDNQLSLSFRVFGRRALFSDPLTRVGGEKMSYQIPTVEAIRGITESIYWKPTFMWKIDRIRIMKPIRYESVGIKNLKMDGGQDLSLYTYLKDVEYQVEAHMEWNLNYPQFADDRDARKHGSIAQRYLSRGGRRDIFLGTRECQGYVEPCVFGEGEGCFDGIQEMGFSRMFHLRSWPEESGEDILRSQSWMPVARKGVIDCNDQTSLGTVVSWDVRPLKRREYVRGVNCSGLAEFATEVVEFVKYLLLCIMLL